MYRREDPVEAVLVINADLGPLHRVSVKHAIRMLCRRVAEIHEAEPDRLIGVYPMPRVVRLVRYVVTRWRFSSGPAWSRAGVLARDGGRCAYCAAAATTVDHVLPRSRGGRNTWKNTVAACYGCNQRKGDRTPVEAGMPLRYEPAAPSWAALTRR
jgi:5-methylcytosine-specific restriction endonuclease McrA